MGLKQIIKKWLLSDNDARLKERDTGLVASSMQTSFYEEAAFRFTVRPAAGGHVVEVISTTNGKGLKQSHSGPSSTLYIVNDDKNLGAELGKIITIETLKS